MNEDELECMNIHRYMLTVGVFIYKLLFELTENSSYALMG